MWRQIVSLQPWHPSMCLESRHRGLQRYGHLSCIEFHMLACMDVSLCLYESFVTVSKGRLMASIEGPASCIASELSIQCMVGVVPDRFGRREGSFRSGFIFLAPHNRGK